MQAITAISRLFAAVPSQYELKVYASLKSPFVFVRFDNGNILNCLHELAPPTVSQRLRRRARTRYPTSR
jgi:hypothetical protein